MRKIASIILIMIISFMCIGTVPAEAKSTLELDKTEMTLVVGKSYTLKVCGTTKKAANKTFKWSSSKPSVATVNKNGKVKAKKAGTTVITAKKGNRKLKCKVTVQTKWKKLLDTYRNDDAVQQLLFVEYKGNAKADVLLYQKEGTKWERILKCTGYVGKNGIDKKKQGDKKTPTGVYNLTSGFGIKSNPGTTMPYVEVNKYQYWCADKKYYNQLVDVREVPHKCTGEHLIDYVPHYNYGMFLDFNKDCKYKKGAAIFLHCTGSTKYTSGCIAVSQKNMIKILQNVQEGAKICIYKK